MSQPAPFAEAARTLMEAGKRLAEQFEAGIRRLNDHLREVRENPAIRDSYRELERERQYERMLANERLGALLWLHTYTEQTRREMGLEP